MKEINNDVKILILEDDHASLDMISDLIRVNFKDCLVETTKTIKEAQVAFENFLPDILILDINLPDGNSMDFLENLFQKGYKNIKVIFTTAYSNYAVKAFRLSALDFLLKPISPQDLISAIEKTIKSLKDHRYSLKLETLFSNQQMKAEKKIVLKTLEDIHIIPLKDIIQAQADNNYTIFFLCDGRQILVSKSLKNFEEELQKFNFMRVHQSHLINTMHILSYQKKRHCVQLANNIAVPVAQSKRQSLLELFNEY
ncbi:LytTR family DNA-binding domain-containing protein [Salegentibacter maritimus]|uniref:Response regulator transcription factor n=1 Tax=Salegentibacter maritimus TaxID=2794347 RepID=A0ABS0TJY9_9FLAO|nr:LytTR family DNA-binding domain-containing protein [Salegentibacter maritimus]MBI6121384.1 response regulator transcription factor [Salegentibacter maritimus]